MCAAYASVLQEGIMEFVNTIAKIVHMEVHLHGGGLYKLNAVDP